MADYWPLGELQGADLVQVFQVINGYLESRVNQLASARRTTNVEAFEILVTEMLDRIPKLRDSLYENNPVPPEMVDPINGRIERYRDEFCRDAYVYTYMAVRVRLIERVLKCGLLVEIARREAAAGRPLNLLSIGCGPGSDVLAGVGFLESLGLSRPSLVCPVVERCEFWFPTLQTIVDVARSQTAVQVVGNVHTIDLCADCPDVLLDLVRQSNAIVMSYVYNEVRIDPSPGAAGFRQAFEQQLSNIAAALTPGTPLIIADINEDGLKRDLRALVDRCGLTVIHEVSESFSTDRLERNALGRFLERMKEREWPQKDAKLHCVWLLRRQ